MYTNRYPFAKQNGKSFFSKFIYGMSMPVHADGEPPTDPPTPNPAPATPPVNFEEMIARVRREEKDKLYGRIKKLEDENATLRTSNNDYILKIAGYQTQVDKLTADLEAAKKQDNEGEVKKLNDKIQSLTAELEEAKKNVPDEAAIRAQVEAEYEVKLYLKDKLAENSDKILPVFVEGVTGKTKEEIDASITAAVDKSTKTKKDLGLIDDDGNPVGGAKGKKKSDKTPKTNPPVVNPAPVDTEEFDPDYVRNLDPRSPEYAEFRKKMGLR